MTRISISTQCKPQGHLVFEKDPFKFSLGYYTDTKGIQWDVRGMGCQNGIKWVQARPRDDHSYYSTADTGWSGSINWKPYTYEVKGDN